jgi:RNA polymerase sigma-70 factor (ECF subfamily)
MLHKLPDGELIARFRKGSHNERNEILLALYDRYKLLILKLCYSYLKDYDRASDVLQDVFIKVTEKLDTLRNPDIFKSWTLAIARNICVDLLRRSSLFLDGEFQALTLEVYSDERAEDKAIAQIQKATVLEHIQECVRKLEPFDSNVFALRCQGMRATQICEMLKVERPVLRMSYERLKKILETCMSRKRLRISIDEILAIGELDG